MDHFAEIADERRRFADLIDSLDPDQLAVLTLCPAWTVHDLAAHLVVPLVTGTGAVLLEVVKARGDFDQVNITLARSMAAKPSRELASLMRLHADSHFAPPGVGSIAPLMDVVVHGQDARRPLGIGREIPRERLVAVLEFLVARASRRGLFGQGRATALRYEASDIGWKYGDGPVVAGAGEALMMALAGRETALDELEGSGVATLRSRVTRSGQRQA